MRRGLYQFISALLLSILILGISGQGGVDSSGGVDRSCQRRRRMKMEPGYADSNLNEHVYSYAQCKHRVLR
jgi:hypothetical protein